MKNELEEREERLRIDVMKQKLVQHKLWLRFLKDMQCPDLCDLILIMISIPPNSGWVERAYSYLDQVCQKKKSRVNVGNLKELLFLAVLKLKPKDSWSYKKEIEILCGNVFFSMEMNIYTINIKTKVTWHHDYS